MTAMIERMTQADVDEVLDIDFRSNPTPWRRESFETELISSFSHPFVMKQDNRIIGFLMLWLIVKEAFISNFAIRFENRCQGNGSLLLRYTLDFCHGLAEEIIVDPRASNARAISIYEKAGFRREGIRPKFYSNGEDAILMSFEMPPESMPEGQKKWIERIFGSVNDSKIRREIYRGELALQISDHSLWRKHQQRIQKIQECNRILRKGVAS